MKTGSVEAIRGLSAWDLFLQCSSKLTSHELWTEFHRRFKKKILIHLWCSFRGRGGDLTAFNTLADDWLQEVYTKLLQHDGRAIRSFRGNSEDSMYAFLATVANSVVADYMRASTAARRSARLVSLDDAISDGNPLSTAPQLIELIDMDKLLDQSEDRENRDRDRLIFRLHFIEGVTAADVAAMPAFKLTVSGVEKVIGRLRKKFGQMYGNNQTE